ncbi:MULTISPECIES: PBP1A family penicillin-binding protein [Methylorubrum]|uniref:PBP1A family penicillin-binding protein n=1 Tax=Methylorubrum TaxID=2282523 RepID=UPI00209F958B|nr:MULTISPECIES: PBP1A family penicillin-binding protein [Methylorubrum]MCP1551392.1 1A family penicillin-binding protein [Methylorubrum zatmanii]MCP1551992.1 1A family penicillin-binding protein [Methylorubrum extorquens]MCP1581697.1 1A family penicillin-binding protein [Methylorubrum extorquens]
MTAQGPDRPGEDGTETRAAAREAARAAALLARQLGRLAGSAGRSAWRSGAAAAREAAKGAKPVLARTTDRLRSDGPPATPVAPPAPVDRSDTQSQPFTHPSARPPRRRRPWVIGLAVVIGLPLVILAGYVFVAFASLPPLGGVAPEANQRALVVESESGRAFATRGAFQGERLTEKTLPPRLAQAIVAIEDRRFYSHWGIDLRGMARAVWRNATGGGVREGGSTITQQYARLTSLTQEKTLKRKIQEAFLALRLESTLTKPEILVGYLNTAYFGAGAYGADAAARRYFGHGAEKLTLPEAAMLAGLVRAPSQLAPTRNFGGAKERADLVLQAMVETGAISGAEADKARAEKLTLHTPPETPPGTNYFLDAVSGDVKRLTEAAGDVTVRSTLNLDLQSLAEGVLARRLDGEGDKKKVGQGALIAMAPDGAILAMVGGRDYEDSQFNRATQAKRQAGSLFKLFVYLAAYGKGFFPDSVLVDRPTQIGEWEPQNSNNRFRGALPLRQAFALSVNTIAAQLGEEVGLPAIIAEARRLGVQSDLPEVPSLALGSADVSLLEMTRAYAGVLGPGVPVEPYLVRTIRGNTPQPLYQRAAPKPGAAMDGQVQSMMLDSLQAVVESGTGKAARVNGLAVGGKTGTSQDYRDGWFVGLTPDMIVGVWVGNDDNTPMNKVTGGDIPARVFHDFVERAQKVLKGRKRPTPSAARAEPTPAAAVAPAPTPAAGEVRGVPEVVDTGTLAIRGRKVRLLGVVGEGGALARQLARYLRRREVICSGDPASVRCRLDGDDLASLIVTAGGARAAEDAPSDLVEAEDQARAERAGLWQRER